MNKKNIIISVVALVAMSLFAIYIFSEVASVNSSVIDEINCDRLHELEQNGTDLSVYSDIAEIRSKC